MEQIFQQNAKFQKERDNFLNNLDLLFRLIKQLTDIAFHGHGKPNMQKTGDFPQFLQIILRYLCNSTNLLERFNRQIQALCTLLKAIGETMAVFSHPRCDISICIVNTIGNCQIVNTENVPDGHCHINDCILPKLALRRHLAENLSRFPNIGEVFAVDLEETGVFRAVRNDLICVEPRTWKLCLIDTGKVIEMPYDLGKLYSLPREIQAIGSQAVSCKVLEIMGVDRKPLDVATNLKELHSKTVLFNVQAIENNILSINIRLQTHSTRCSSTKSDFSQIAAKNEIIDLVSDNDEAETAAVTDAVDVEENQNASCNSTIGSDGYETEVEGDTEGMSNDESNACSNELHVQDHQFVCEVCGHEFGTKVEIEIHMNVHSRKIKKPKSTKETNRQHNCRLCDKAFGCNSNLKRHERIHTNEKPFSCDICKKAFYHKSSLIHHKKIHSGEKPHKCNVCGKGFIERNNLVRHLETHKINCKLCGQVFGQADDLKQHVQRQHGQTAFICCFCGKMFKTKRHLQRHLNLHTKKTKFACKICGKIYFNQSTLAHHSKIHSGEIFICRICGRNFNQKGHLNGHLKIHTREKPFICVFCKKAFINNYKLKIHSMTHSKNR